MVVNVSCVKVEEHQAVDIDLYHCPNCAILHGASLMKKRNNWHRHDYTETADPVKKIQAGTPVFIRELRARHFPSAGEILIKLHGTQLTHKYLEKHGFEFPIMVSKIDGLGISLPSSTFSVRDVQEYVGGEKVIDVIDVARQADCKMKLQEFVDYYTALHRTKVLNVISLEFSDTKMSELVEVPDIVQKLSWVENYWPEDSFFPKPCVQKYCLMGMEDSYTDFHIDFGGTSVWYHVLWGEKLFYLIKPTDANLALYESWSGSVNQSETFFGDQVDKCYKCILQQGQTLFIPTGWIHAVLTSKDCMAFEMREDSCQPQEYLIEGVKALIPTLKCWIQKEGLIDRPYEIPDHIRPGQLIKELGKEIRFVEEMNTGNKPIKSQGITATVPATRVTQDKGSPSTVSPGKRKCRRLRDPSNRIHSDLDILELHTRAVLKKMEMAQWGEDNMSSSTLRVKISKSSSPSSGAEKGPSDNNLQLVLSKGRIISHNRDELEFDQCSTDSEAEEEDQSDDRCNKLHEADSSDCEDEKLESQNPLNRFFESMKTELGDGMSKSSDLSDSDVEMKYSLQRADSRSKESHRSSGSENGLTIQSEAEESQQMLDKPRTSLKRCKKDSTVEREWLPSQSTAETIQGMLSMAALQYSDLRNNRRKNSDSMDKRNLPRSQDMKTNQREEEEQSPQSRAAECVGPVKQEAAESSSELVNHEARSLLRTAAKLSEEVWKERKHLGKEASVRQTIQEKKNLMGEHEDNEGQIPTDSLSVVYRSSADHVWGDCEIHNSESLEHIHSVMPTSPSMHPSSKRTLSNPPPVSNQATKGKRPKKGMATAKQRLGKILKLNRSGRLFL
ncbi:hypothetical protein chiPu_0016130 [Chiloscyllium punctatum]|uniref:JmjC domain-containing protein n=1 Tax=Chiloscyllium punctatum TaxID=137246 RepID=A0A401T4R4_CHIPU|nr:hypothetical protein [Chiloscyllium punctatum]